MDEQPNTRSAQLPPHLIIAKDVTEVEYRRSKFQFYITWASAMLGGILTAAIPLAFIGMKNSLISGVFSAIVIERILHALLKDGKNYRSVRIQTYPKLRAFQEHLAKNSAS